MRDTQTNDSIADLTKDGETFCLSPRRPRRQGKLPLCDLHQPGAALRPGRHPGGDARAEGGAAPDCGHRPRGKSERRKVDAAVRSHQRAAARRRLSVHDANPQPGDDAAVRRRDIILADIPGIIEGAAQGRGMGLRFLRHVERCAALLYLVDLSEADAAGRCTCCTRSWHPTPPVLPRGRVSSSERRWISRSRRGLEALAAALPEDRVLGISSFSREGLAELKTSHPRARRSAATADQGR